MCLPPTFASVVLLHVCMLTAVTRSANLLWIAALILLLCHNISAPAHIRTQLC